MKYKVEILPTAWEDLKKIRDEAAKKLKMRHQVEGVHVTVSMGTCGIAAGARPVLNAFVEEVNKKCLYDVIVLQSGCMGECDNEPVVEVVDKAGNKTVYGKVSVSDVEKIVSEHIEKGQVVTDLVLNK